MDDELWVVILVWIMMIMECMECRKRKEGRMGYWMGWDCIKAALFVDTYLIPVCLSVYLSVCTASRGRHSLWGFFSCFLCSSREVHLDRELFRCLSWLSGSSMSVSALS